MRCRAPCTRGSRERRSPRGWRSGSWSACGAYVDSARGLDRAVGRRDGLDERRSARRGPCRARRPGRSLAADHQTAGRGRLGRRWQAPPGSSLLVSMLFHAEAPKGLHRYTQAVRARRCRRVPGGRWRLGLPEVAERRDGRRPQARGHPRRDRAAPPGKLAVVVGIGMNVTWPRPLPEDARRVTMTALNLECGEHVDRDAVLALHARPALDLDRLVRPSRSLSGRLSRSAARCESSRRASSR